jgi:hypothetical protein
VAPDLEPEVAAVISRAMKHDVNERYQSADEMLADIEHVLRNVYRPVGQTELKRWLAELSAHDGTPSILKATGRATSGRGGTGTGELDGKDVVLSDSQEIEEDEEIDTEARTSLAVVEAAGGGRITRMSRARSTHAPTPLALPVPRDAEADLEGRASEELAALSVPDTEEPPDRRRKRSGSGFMKFLLLVGVLAIPGAWVYGKYGREWFGLGQGDTATPAGGPSAGQANQPAVEKAQKPAATEQPAANPKPAAAAAAAEKAKEEAKAREEARAREEAKAKEEAKAEKPAAREPASRRKGATSERVREPVKDRLHTIDLKNMMAPDPSQLPPPEPKPAPPSEPPAQENP